MFGAEALHKDGPSEMSKKLVNVVNAGLDSVGKRSVWDQYLIGG